MFLPNDSRAGGERLFDWGAWRPGLPAIDLACMMAMHWFSPNAAGASSGPFLDHYHATLLASGVKGYDRAVLDHDYRSGCADPDDDAHHLGQHRHSSPSVWLYNFERIMLAVDDLGCHELLA